MKPISDPQSDGFLRLEAASTWRVRIEADEAVRQSEAFLVWLSGPHNQEAFALVCATWNTFDDYLAAPELIAIRRDALTRVRRETLDRSMPLRRVLAVASIILVGCVAAFGLWQISPHPTEYSTDIGERRTIALEDGSRILLDSNSSVEVQYTTATRELKLLRGRARFDVAHNIARPFTVTAGNETVVAVGTSFNVEWLGPKVLVTLLEGRVVVKLADKHPTALHAGKQKPASMIAGQMLIAARDMQPVLTPVSLSVANAWEGGRLIFDNTPLADAVEQVNRYTDMPLQVDPAVADVRISGAFNAGDVPSFVDAITSYFPVQASTSADNQVILQKRS